MPSPLSPPFDSHDAFLASIVNSSNDGIISKDLHGIITSWNPAAERIFGYAPEEIIGQSVLKLIPPERHTEEDLILNRLRRGERIDHFRTVRLRKDGQPIQVSLTISPICDKSGAIIGASKIASDVSLMIKAEEQMHAHAADLEVRVHERTSRLQETVAELEAFSYSLSHDLRAPLRAIQGYAELLLEEESVKTPEAAEHLRKIVAASTRMNRLIADVLNFARISRREIDITPIDVEALVDDVLQQRPELLARQTHFQVERPLLAVRGHEPSLLQCLTNLIDNAVKFVPSNRAPHVRVHTQSQGEKVRLCVTDNGIGIDDEGQKRLFSLFERLNASQSYQGTGVGLAIVRRAVERMQGKVGVESAPGLGSTFWLELPKA